MAVDAADVRMVQGRKSLGFALKPREAFRIVGDRRQQHLDRDLATQLRIAGTIHSTHAPETQEVAHDKCTEARAGSEGGGRHGRANGNANSAMRGLLLPGRPV